MAEKGSPAIIPEWRRATRLQQGQRTMTMLRPVCHLCSRADNAPPDWYKDCPHDPYVSMAITPQAARYEPVLDDKGEPTGQHRPVATDLVSYRPVPNTSQVPLTEKVSSGRQVEKKLAQGFIFPENLRSPHFPNGIAPTCQFRDCKWQKDLKTYKNGVFCREREAQLVWFNERGPALNVAWDSLTSEIREKQLQEATV